MGIYFGLITATDEMIEQIHAEPLLINRLHSPEEEYYFDEISEKELPVPVPIPGFIYAEGERLELDIDKAWTRINRRLKKIAPVGSPNLFEGGEVVGNIDPEGDGYSMTFLSSDTKRLSEIYMSIDPEEIWQRDKAKTKEYLTYHFKNLQEYLQVAASRNLGIVTSYT